jgi:hypothetical protein
MINHVKYNQPINMAKIENLDYPTLKLHPIVYSKLSITSSLLNTERQHEAVLVELFV